METFNPTRQAEIGDKLYYERFLQEYAPEHMGEILAIDIESEKAYLGHSVLEALGCRRKGSQGWILSCREGRRSRCLPARLRSGDARHTEQVTRSFEFSSSPSIDIDVFGHDRKLSQGVSAIVDTGFTGFLLLPSGLAPGLGLLPHTTIDITLANGVTQRNLLCRGSIGFEGQTAEGAVILEEQTTEALVGMGFLTAFRLVLTVDAVALLMTLEPSALVNRRSSVVR